MMKRLLAGCGLAVAIVAGALSAPEIANAAETAAPGAPADAPAYDPTVTAPGAGDLTWVQANSLAAQPSTYSDPSSTGSVSARSTAALGAGCTIDTRNIYKRKSGSGFPHGGVGGKPKTSCGTLMVRISQSTTMYKLVWWGLQRVGGPYNAINAGQPVLEQKNVLRKCDDSRQTTFRMQVRSTGTFPTGTTGTASAFQTKTLNCGTNP